MKNILYVFLALLTLSVHARENVNNSSKGVTGPLKTLAYNCAVGTAQTLLDINNVKTTIMNGGDMWWNLSSGRYEIPKGSGKHSLFAGAIWIGGMDDDDQLKVAAQTYRQSGNDFWPGPLDNVRLSADGNPNSKYGTTEATVCAKYDYHHVITRAEVEEFVAYSTSQNPSVEFPDYSIPLSILNYPGNREDDDQNENASEEFDEQVGTNPYYALETLAPFRDIDGDGSYNPASGDYPEYNLDGTYNCQEYDMLFGDQTLWWVYNDNGESHTESGSVEPIGLEIQAQAFAFSTNDEINNMTFYNYKLINRSHNALNEAYFGVWVDPDLGDYQDDYVGCDVARGLGYCYNGDEDDGTAAGYGANPPAIGVDFFRGPVADEGDGLDNDMDGIIDEPGEQIIMSKFMYFNNDGSVTGNPDIAQDFYNYLQGKWLDNKPMTYGADGRNPSSPLCNYMFPGDTDPEFEDSWTEQIAGNAPADRRFVQSAGPFTLEPGAINTITTGVVWSRANEGGAWASVEKLKVDNDVVQELFNNCFELQCVPPDASTLTYSIVEENYGFDMQYNLQFNYQIVNFNPQITWDFGDGSTANNFTPIHTYETPGDYSVYFTVINECGADSSFLDVHVPFNGSCMNLTACNYNPEATVDDGSCVYPGENEFATHVEWFFDVNQIDNGLLDEEYLVFVQGTDVFSQGSDIFTQGTDIYTQGTDVFNQGTNTFSQWITVHLEGENVFSQGSDLLFYGVSSFLDMLVEEIYEMFWNYDEAALFDCDGCVNDIDGNNICDEFQVGCPYPEFLEYDSTALYFDFSLCETYIINGCMDTLAENYNELANLDDGTCDYLVDCETLSDWEVINTGTNMTIMIPADIEVLVNGEQVSDGSAIGVFYEDSFGAERCAGYAMLTGETTHIAAMANDETTEEVDGLSPGDEMVWKIYNSTSCIEYVGAVVYSSGSNVFTPNNLVFLESVTYSCQTIEFPAGWFMYSTYIESENTDLVIVLEELDDNIIIVKNNNGEAYLPEWNYNGIGNQINGQGYSIKLYNAETIDICGTYLLPELNPIGLDAGWNTIAYLRSGPANIQMVMESIIESDNLIIIKDYNGNPYLPEWNYNGIGDMMPGQGYHLKVSQSDTLHYISNIEEYRSASLPIITNNLKHYKKVVPTGNNMHIIFPNKSWTTQAFAIKEMAAFNKEGILVGSTSFTNENTVLTLWGNDETTSSVDGLNVKESISFKLWNGKEELDFEILDWTEGSNEYSVNAINIVGTVKIGEEGNQLFDAQPNPSNTVTTISFFIAEKGNVKISVYNVLGELVKGVVNSENTKGYHSIKMNVSHLKPGSYYYTMETNNFKKSKQLVIIK